MTTGKETVCSLCHGEVGPDIYGRAICYGCGPDELMPPERRKARSLEQPPPTALESVRPRFIIPRPP